jgi:catechol 2,3-dioxygenase-like lactoylglutathione lyase family enzyme
MIAMLDHVSIQCADMAASASFYDAVLAPLGGRRIMDFGAAIGYGTPDRPDFWIGAQAAGDGFRESHIAFAAPDRAAVLAFCEAARAVGVTVLHEPRVWRSITSTTTPPSRETRTGTTSRLSATSRDKELASGVRGVRSG